MFFFSPHLNFFSVLTSPPPPPPPWRKKKGGRFQDLLEEYSPLELTVVEDVGVVGVDGSGLVRGDLGVVTLVLGVSWEGSQIATDSQYQSLF